MPPTLQSHTYHEPQSFLQPEQLPQFQPLHQLSASHTLNRWQSVCHMGINFQCSATTRSESTVHPSWAVMLILGMLNKRGKN